jgi:hypothetical protein
MLDRSLNTPSLVCHLALVAARALLGALRGDGQNDNKLATIPSEPAVLERASPWPKCDAPALPRHDGRSDSPAR